MVGKKLLATACALCLGTATSVYADDAAEFCYAVADNDGLNQSADVLVTFNRTTGIAKEIGSTGTMHIEAVAFNPESSGLYAADEDQLGVLDLVNGTFVALSNKFGSGQGSEGTVVFDDVDGLTFDMDSNVLYGTQRDIQQKDILFKINPVTGERIANAFGEGIDYVVISGPELDVVHNVDDIASDPTTGQLYASVNIHGQQGYLVVINTTTGIATPVGSIQTADGETVRDIEGLGFAANGELYGSTGNKNSSQSYLYQLDKATASATLVGPFDSNRDFEALDCLTGDISQVKVNSTGCNLYALHDEGRNDSQFIIIDPKTGQVNKFGDLHADHDLEGLDVHPLTEILYATSGNDNWVGEKGYLYTVDAKTGELAVVGDTGFDAIPGLAFNPSTRELWGYTDQKTGGAHGLIKIDTTTGAATLEHETPNAKWKAGYVGIEALAWSVDGQTLYAADDTKLYTYQDGEFTLKCDNFDSEVEGLEAMPNGHLVFTLHPNNFTDTYVYDPEQCKLAEGQRFVTGFNDIESVAWPAACGNVTLTGEGVDLETPEVQSLATLQTALTGLGISGVTTDDAGNLHVPVTEGVRYVVRPDRQSKRADDGSTVGLHSLSENDVLTSLTLTFADEDEENRDQPLHPASPNEDVLEQAIKASLSNVQNVIIYEDGKVKIKIAFQYYIGQLDFLVTSGGESSENGSLVPTADLNADGINDFLITYPNGEKQILFYKGSESAS